MNLYKVSRTDGVDWDQYDSFVACAKDEDAARRTLPSHDDDPADPKWTWGRTWVRKDQIHTLTVRLIGTASHGMKRGCVLSSFNAG